MLSFMAWAPEDWRGRKHKGRFGQQISMPDILENWNGCVFKAI